MSCTILERPILGRKRNNVPTTEVEDIFTVTPLYPVTVEGDRLEIDSAQLEIERVYSFNYLGVKMVLWKSPDGTIDLFQIIEE